MFFVVYALSLHIVLVPGIKKYRYFMKIQSLCLLITVNWTTGQHIRKK